MDMMGINYIGPFSPIAESGAHICIMTDYATRYMFADTVPVANSANTAMVWKRSVSNIYGNLRAVYNNNSSHFAGDFTLMLKEEGVHQISAAISHPSVVGLSERYVQLMLSMLRAELQNDSSQIFQWDEVIPKLTHTANA